MAPLQPNKKHAAVKAACLAASHHFLQSMETCATVLLLVAQDEDKKSSQCSSKERDNQQGRFTRIVLHDVKDSFWRNILDGGDDLEFLHFTALTRESF